MRAPIKITVLKRTLNNNFLDEYADSRWELCDQFSEGQEFISPDGYTMPPGFCGWAWGDIQKCVLTLSRSGNFTGVKQGTFVSCCTDGFRPVFFKLERMES
jgi:uncharacterized repeat protein (TIGR04076 family)